jgi:hypothetical protein
MKDQAEIALELVRALNIASPHGGNTITIHSKDAVMEIVHLDGCWQAIIGADMVRLASNLAIPTCQVEINEHMVRLAGNAERLTFWLCRCLQEHQAAPEVADLLSDLGYDSARVKRMTELGEPHALPRQRLIDVVRDVSLCPHCPGCQEMAQVAMHMLKESA